MGRFSDFLSLTVIIFLIIFVALFIWESESYPVTTRFYVALATAVVLSVIVIGLMIGSDEHQARFEAEQMEQKEMEKRQREEKRKAEQDAEEKIAKPIRIELRKRIRALLRENAGEFYDAMDIQSGIGVTTASEDYHFENALRIACRTDLAAKKGYRYIDKEIGYETTRRYYYYVDPNE